MLVVMLWHIVNVHTPWADSWVMPIFFFIMGLFYKQDASFKHMLIKKTNTLLVPLVFCSIPAFAKSLVQNGWMATLKIIADPYQNINCYSWFLVCMFFCYVIYWGINKITVSDKQRVLLSLVVSLVGFSSTNLLSHKILLPFFIGTALTMMFVIEMGRLAKKHLLSEKMCGGGVFALFTVLFLSLTIAFPPHPQNMIMNEYGTRNYALYMASSLVGSAWVLLLCRRLDYVLRWTAVIGRLSMLILLLHMYVWLLLGPFVDNAVYKYPIVVVLTVAIAYAIDKYLPIVSGKKPVLKIEKK